jgi:allantoate deiminase
MMSLSQTVMQRCDILAKYSEDPLSLTRRYLTPPMHDVHGLIRQWMEEAGLTVRVDAVGNICGRRPAASAMDGSGRRHKCLLMGSHLDTVPNAGKYDGILGLLISIAVSHSLKEIKLPFALEVIGFSEDEGVRFQLPFIGSHAMAGSFQPAWLATKDEQQRTLAEAIIDFKLDPDQIPKAAYAPEEVLGFIEPHLEQGPILEQQGAPLGIVEAIAGQSRLVVAFRGRAAHAGTTPMNMRQDALAGAARWIGEVQELGRRVPGLRATVGRLSVAPNASNVIPASVELSLDVRHADDGVREQAIESLLDQARLIARKETLAFEVLQHLQSSAVSMSPEMMEGLSQSMKECKCPAVYLTSGAGHDAMVMAKRFPTAMLFLRHPNAVSHHPDEFVAGEDVAVAIEILKQFLLRTAKEISHVATTPLWSNPNAC